MKNITEILNIKYPLIIAPMFLVSNTAMVIEGMKMGVAGCIPALNYRTIAELVAAIEELKQAKTENGSFGFNLIVNQSNPKFLAQLDAICEHACMHASMQFPCVCACRLIMHTYTIMVYTTCMHQATHVRQHFGGC